MIPAHFWTRGGSNPPNGHMDENPYDDDNERIERPGDAPETEESDSLSESESAAERDFSSEEPNPVDLRVEIDVSGAEKLSEQNEGFPRSALRDIASLIKQGLSGMQAIDYYATRGAGDYDNWEWANLRGVHRKTIWTNIHRAEQVLEEDEDG